MKKVDLESSILKDVFEKDEDLPVKDGLELRVPVCPGWSLVDSREEVVAEPHHDLVDA